MLYASENSEGVANIEKVYQWSRDPGRFLTRYVSKKAFLHTIKLQPFTVYGDDIVCDSNTTGYVTRLLQHLGFTVNTEKSFTGNQSFRESCGEFYTDGFRVTPIYFSVKRFDRELTPTSYQSLIGMINKCGHAGYRNLHSYFINLLKAHAKKHGLVPFFTDNIDDSSAIYSKNVHHTVTSSRSAKMLRYNKRYQRDERRVTTIGIKDKVEFDPSLDEYGLLQFRRRTYMTKGNQDETIPGFVRYDPIKTRWKWIWTPFP
jgi:hypothetical protein